MKISAGDGYKPLHGLLPSSQLVTLCGLLVLINLSIIWLGVKECHSGLYVLPLLLMGALVKLVWDHSNRLFSLLVVLLTLAVFVVLYTNLAETRRQQELRLVYNILQQYSGRRDEETVSKPKPVAASKPDLNVFFIETSTHGKEVLTYRELCAIESAALHNPDAQVVVLTMNAKAALYGQGARGPELTDAYKNVKVRRLEPLELFNSTPLMSWWLKGNWSVSPYILAHISDAARLALLWRHGGFYSDLDTITLKSVRPASQLASLGHMVERRGDSLGNGVMSFEKGHPFLRQVMSAFDKAYDPFAWGNTGPLLVERELKAYCRNDKIYQSQLIDQATFEGLVGNMYTLQSPGTRMRLLAYGSPGSYCDVVIYPRHFYYPFDYRFELKQMFEANGRLPVAKLAGAFSVHFYGKLSAKFKVRVGDNSLYEYLAMNHCPLVYSSVKAQRVDFS